MLNKTIMNMIFPVFLGLILLAQPAYASYWDREKSHDHRYRHNYRHDRHHSHPSYRIRHPYPPYGRAVITLPGGFLTVVFGGRKFFYSDGIYYDRRGRDYVVIAPPVGAILTSLPYDYRTIIINGDTYYVSRDIYYKHCAYGYEVMAQPRVTVIQTAQAVPRVYVRSPDEAFTVNIPNNKGGYVAITLKRSGDGYVGPQGEYYPEFPNVDQLKVMYGGK